MSIILHSDINAFYASVEELYHPEYRRVPMAVCGDQELRHGIVLAKNEKAKRCGVKTGEAIWQARKKCQELVISPAHGNLYVRYSKEVRGIYQFYAKDIEPFGLDECWLDLTQSLKDPIETAKRLQTHIYRETGLTVSIGISFNKIMAKLASDLKKPNAVTILRRQDLKTLIWQLPLENLLFAGPQTVKKLKRINIRTIGDFANLDFVFVRTLLGLSGVKLWHYARGETCDNFSEGLTSRRDCLSCGRSVTLPHDLTDKSEVNAMLLKLSEEVAIELRRQLKTCACVQLYVRFSDLSHFTTQEKLSRNTDITKEIYESSKKLFFQKASSAFCIRSLGVRAVSLQTKSCNDTANDLLAIVDKQYEQYRRWYLVEKTMDTLRQIYGSASIGHLAILTPEKQAVESNLLQLASDRQILPRERKLWTFENLMPKGFYAYKY